MNKKVMKLTNMDFPDPDVIRVGENYYMISTTMHFCPGGQILSSKDLIHWKHESYVYDILQPTDGRRLCGDSHIYGKGMWAATLRYHAGSFYVCFVANDTHKTYLYKSSMIAGPWEMQEIEGFYHDCSLLFDDEKAYLVYGNTQIFITELNSDLTGPKEGGFHKMILEDKNDVRLGYEGSHIYIINGRYYLFLIHWPNYGSGRRIQACFVSDSLDGEWNGRDVFDWDGGFRNSGVAQGGIVDTPEGNYYAIMFQDSGAVGRIPVLVPIEFRDGWPVFCKDAEDNYGEVIHQMSNETLYVSDSFAYYSVADLASEWQWNHIPDFSLVSVSFPKGELRIRTDKTVHTLTMARNILTQRMLYPACGAQISVEADDLQNGDYAGICALQGAYTMIALHKTESGFKLVVRHREENGEVWGYDNQDSPDILIDEISWEQSNVRLRLEASFADKDICRCFYFKDGEWKPLGGIQPLVFRLDHFTGCRFGLFTYSTVSCGGSAVFRDFKYCTDCIIKNL